MKHLLPILAVLLASCATAPAEPKTEQELSVVMALGIQDVAGLKVGQWALYSVRRDGSMTPRSTRIAVVGEENGKLWIENRTTSDQGLMVFKSLVDRSGELVELWMGEPNTTRPVKIYPGVDGAGKPIRPPKRSEPEPAVDVQIAKETVTIGGRSFECTRLTTTASHTGGTSTTLTTWCSPTVPFGVAHKGTVYGGVVRRAYGKYVMELISSGSEGTAEELKVR